MVKKIYAVLASLVLVAASWLVLAPSASAAPTVPVGPGTGLSNTAGVTPSLSACSFAAIGRDSANRLVGITAGHCQLRVNAAPGTPVYKSTTGQQIGWFTNINSWSGGNPPGPVLDYAVIHLDENVVIPRSVSEDGQLTVNSIGNANLWNNVCKNGIGTGNTCGLVNGTSTPNKAFTSWALAGPGDSGGGAVLAGTGTLVGYVLGSNPTLTNFIYQKVQPVLADLTARGSFGAGFTPVP